MTDEKPGAELEQQSEYEAAAASYAVEGFRELITSGFELNNSTYIGIGMLLQAISCDRRVGTHRRPVHLADICRPLLEEIRETAEDPVLVGLATEWLGDLALMLGDETVDVQDYYNEAATRFEDLNWQDKT